NLNSRNSLGKINYKKPGIDGIIYKYLVVHLYIIFYKNIVIVILNSTRNEFEIENMMIGERYIVLGDERKTCPTVRKNMFCTAAPLVFLKGMNMDIKQDAC
ncbi:hypothetical protein ACJX0J_034106, partial [Zea mays]